MKLRIQRKTICANVQILSDIAFYIFPERFSHPPLAIAARINNNVLCFLGGSSIFLVFRTVGTASFVIPHAKTLVGSDSLDWVVPTLVDGF